MSIRCSTSPSFENILKIQLMVDWGEITFDTYGTFEEGPMRILDSRDKVLRCKTVRLVKVLW